MSRHKKRYSPDGASLIAEAEALYDAYQLDALPPALCRNSLDYYYLSIYPSLAEMRPLASVPSSRLSARSRFSAWRRTIFSSMVFRVTSR